MVSSCSFRITRTAEDLAQTINSLSRRLVKLEQRQEVFELEFSKSQKETSVEEIERLDSVDELLKECRELLENSSRKNDSDEGSSDAVIEDIIAA